MHSKVKQKILILTDDEGFDAALLHAKKLKAQPSCLIWQIDHTPLSFTPVPSKILLPHFPPHMTAALPLLDDYHVASRLCGLELPGFWEGSMANLLQQFGSIFLPAYEEVFIYGNNTFIQSCRGWTDQFIKISRS